MRVAIRKVDSDKRGNFFRKLVYTDLKLCKKKNIFKNVNNH